MSIQRKFLFVVMLCSVSAIAQVQDGNDWAKIDSTQSGLSDVAAVEQ